MDFTIRQINAGPLIEAQLQSALARHLTARTTAADGAAVSAADREPFLSQATAGGNELRRRKGAASDPEANIAISDASTPPRGASVSFCSICRIPLRVLLYAYRAVATWILWLVALPITLPFAGVKQRKLTDVSIFAQQLDRRFRETMQLPSLWTRMRQTSKFDERASAAFMRFWGSVTRIFVDVVVGFVCFWLLLVGSATVLRSLHYGGQILHLEVLQQQIRWLMEQPAGAKLNLNLSYALGSSILFCLDIWNALTTIATPFEPLIVAVISCVGVLGWTLAVALATDLVFLVTVHIDMMHKCTCGERVIVILGSFRRRVAMGDGSSCHIEQKKFFFPP